MRLNTFEKITTRYDLAQGCFLAVLVNIIIRHANLVNITQVRSETILKHGYL